MWCFSFALRILCSVILCSIRACFLVFGCPVMFLKPWTRVSQNLHLRLLHSLQHALIRECKHLQRLPFYVVHKQHFSHLLYFMTYSKLSAKPLGIKLCSNKSCSAPATKKLAHSKSYKIIYCDKHAAEQLTEFFVDIA